MERDADPVPAAPAGAALRGAWGVFGTLRLSGVLAERVRRGQRTSAPLCGSERSGLAESPWPVEFGSSLPGWPVRSSAVAGHGVLGVPSPAALRPCLPAPPHRAQPSAVPAAGQALSCRCAFHSESPSQPLFASPATGHSGFSSRIAPRSPELQRPSCSCGGRGTPVTAIAQRKPVVDLLASGTLGCRLPEGRGCTT